MATLRLLVMASLVPALFAAVGALAASPLGRSATFVAGSITGTAGVLLAGRWLAALGWFDGNRHRGGAIGGLVGLGLGTSLAVTASLQPVMVAIGALLVGIGTLVGAGPGAAR
jgi:hypothetical protein